MKFRKEPVGLAMTVFACVMAGILSGSTANAGTGSGQQVDPMSAQNVQRGEKLFQSSCAFCHGPTAKGTATGASLIDSSLVRHDVAGELIGKVIREGRVEKGMPPFPIFDKTQVEDLTAYVHARVKATDSLETQGPKGGYQLQKLLTGNAAAGEAYFRGAGGCVKCHDSKGDLAGVATKYRPSELEGRMLYPRGKMPSGVITLASGKTVTGTVVHRDAFYVAVVDHDGNYHSWDVSKVKLRVDDPLSGHLTLLGKYTNKDVHDLFAYLETLK